jgi:protein-S-isoprenylcysteine O-methyltransferase Ste14
MKLKLPPGLIMIFFVAIMLILEKYIPIGMLDFNGHHIVGQVLSGVGVLIGVLGLWEFYKASTTIDPHSAKRVSTIVTSGIYQFSRNPMYVALVCITISVGFYLGDLLTLSVVPVFILYLHYLQIIPEEEALEEKFGDKFREYKSEVRRWI